MAYSTSDLNSIITNLEGALAQGAAEVWFEGRKLVYRSVKDIQTALTYFKGLLSTATDAPSVPAKRVRVVYPVTNKGFGGGCW